MTGRSRRAGPWRTTHYTYIDRIELRPSGMRGDDFEVFIVSKRQMERKVYCGRGCVPEKHEEEIPIRLSYLFEKLKISDKEYILLQLLKGASSTLWKLAETYRWHQERAEEKDRVERKKERAEKILENKKTNRQKKGEYVRSMDI